MGYLTNRYKGKYRLKCEYDKRDNQFPTKIDGSFEDADVYIDCINNIRVFHYGRGILQAYVPSVKRGHNIIDNIKDFIFDIEETDEEILFKFKATYDEKVLPVLKPKTNGAGISPFSSKNLPKNKYNIPEDDMKKYKDIIKDCTIENGGYLMISKKTIEYIKSLSNKRHSLESIKADIKKVGLKPREYIHSIGKWDDYINFLTKGLKNEN